MLQWEIIFNTFVAYWRRNDVKTDFLTELILTKLLALKKVNPYSIPSSFQDILSGNFHGLGGLVETQNSVFHVGDVNGGIVVLTIEV